MHINAFFKEITENVITVSTQTYEFVAQETISTQHLCIPCAVYQNINFHCTNIMSGEKNVRLLITFLLAYILSKTVLSCLFAALLVSWPCCPFPPSFDNINQNLTWPLICIRFFLLSNYITWWCSQSKTLTTYRICSQQVNYGSSSTQQKC